ncbi:hypothetical protein AXG93_672s1020 [Marchantia polymorpha subsp. ruderalis]|uniref:Uncharacterized protein n=1 Tax=Marchantia polymorpha subsp. ruderalis TaxID=1480154 RepID=A0A176WS50_MARPO|nr:hypothetical protein AXG93_672s1020 [Marchantia polymorpha subsp. ruderalis]
MAPSKMAKVRKLVLLKKPYEELRPYRRELSELHLDFLLYQQVYAEEKRFLKELEILTIESSKGIEEEDNGRPRVPSQTIAHGPVQVDVLPKQKRPERRLAKRRKVLTDNMEDPLLKSRMAKTEIAEIWQSRTQARPKKKANRGVIESSDSSVEKTIVVAVAIAKDKSYEPTLQVLEGVPSAVSIEVTTGVPPTRMYRR